MILVDTTPRVALCDARDSQHTIAVNQLGRLAPAGLCTCEAALTECCFHLPIGNSGSAFMHCSMHRRSPPCPALASEVSGPTYSTGPRNTQSTNQTGQTTEPGNVEMKDGF